MHQRSPVTRRGAGGSGAHCGGTGSSEVYWGQMGFLMLPARKWGALVSPHRALWEHRALNEGLAAQPRGRGPKGIRRRQNTSAGAELDGL